MSATVAAMKPGVSRVVEIGTMPSAGYRPIVGRSPATPVTAAGTRTEPPVSVPSPAGTAPAATSAAVPLDEPPANRSVSYGLRTPMPEPVR